MEQMNAQAIDLFAGAGGATVGIEALGLKVIAAVESDPVAASTFRSNHPECWVIENDIRAVQPRQVMARLGLERGQLTLLNSCPPCQGFSSLHKGDKDEERNDLVLETWRWTRALRPRIVMLENVPGLRKTTRFAGLMRRLRSVGYGVAHWLLDAARLGVPQRRVRLVMVAVRGRKKHQLPAEQDFDAAAPVLSAADVLASLESIDVSGDPLHRCRRRTPLTQARIDAIPPGGNRFDLPSDLILDCHRRLGERRVASGPYSRVPLCGPSHTLTTRCTTPSCGAFVHPTENRGLSLREAALLQTFPRHYHFTGGYDAIERQIGNAIPPVLTQTVLASIFAEA